MFRNLRLKRPPEPRPPEPMPSPLEHIARDAHSPVALRFLNALPETARLRVYRALLPPALLTRFSIDPITGKAADGEAHFRLKAEPDDGAMHLSVKRALDDADPFVCVELSDNAFNSVDLNLLLLNDPDSPRFGTDYDEDGHPTLFGTARRNRTEEARAMQAGLAPAQVRSSLGASERVLAHVDTFLGVLGHRAYFLEPLTYVSAWIFERRGFAYVRGHKLMDDIHKEFQPGGRLHPALDGSTPFRRPEQWNTVRGRAWAIQDGILDAIGAQWNGLRMVKQIGRHAGVETFPGAVY